MQVQECMVFRKAGKQLHQSCLLDNEQNWSKHHSAQDNDGSEVFSFMYPIKNGWSPNEPAISFVMLPFGTLPILHSN